MKDYLAKALKARLELMYNFAQGKGSKEYKHVDLLNGVETKYVKLEDFPCEFTLLLGDKTLVNKAKNSYHPEVWEFIKNANKTWEYFTGDHLHPVPNVFGHGENYNPTLVYYAMKKHNVLWLKKSGDVRRNYLEHLLECLK